MRFGSSSSGGDDTDNSNGNGNDEGGDHDNRNKNDRVDEDYNEDDDNDDDGDKVDEETNHLGDDINEEAATTTDPMDQLDCVYGATLTSLDPYRALRYGGFRSGGYSMESSQVAILELSRTKKKSKNDSGSSSSTKYKYTATWTVQDCTVCNDPVASAASSAAAAAKADDDDATATTTSEMWQIIAARAYHSSTLLFDRYLFVVGGMQGSPHAGCIFSPILLDTWTWTWYHEGIATAAAVPPCPRFGHSVVTDYSWFGCKIGGSSSSSSS
jgi:hypothetical protein